MKKNIVLILVMLSLVFCKTNSINKKSTIKTPTTLKENFPKDWTGNYVGELQIYGVDSIRMTAKMKLIIAKKTDSLYNWMINYNINGKEDIRAYELLVVDSKKGHYVIDEKNSIKIDAFYHNRIFTSFFKVMNSYIVASYTKVNNSIIFEIISASNQKKIITGNTFQKGDSIPKVVTYFVNGRQKAILEKQ